MEINLVAEGFKFMILGMVTVFLFLMLIVYILKLQYYIINKFFNEDDNLSSNESKNLNDDKIDQNVVVAITAAIKQFQTSQKR